MFMQAPRCLIFVLISLVVLLIGTPKPSCAEQLLAAILPADLPRYQQAHNAMVDVLRKGGLDENTLKVFVQRPNPDKMSIINSLRRSAAAGASLIVAYGSFAADLAATETKGIPLVFADVYDPVAMGIVKTLSAPGVEATGATSKTDLDLLVNTLVTIKPVKTVGALYTKGDSGSELQLAELKSIADKLGLSVIEKTAGNGQEIKQRAQDLFATCDATYLTESLTVGQNADAIVLSALTEKTLVFSQIPGLVSQGALIGLEADPDEQGKLAAVHALQILKGQKAYVLPVRSARKIILTINASSAKGLGITIPPDVAGRVVLSP